MPKNTLLEFDHPLKADLEGWLTLAQALEGTKSSILELRRLTPRGEVTKPESRNVILLEALYYYAVQSYLRCFASGRKHRLDIHLIPGLTTKQIELHEYLRQIRNRHIAHPVGNEHESTHVGLIIPHGTKAPTHFSVMHVVLAGDSLGTLQQFMRLVEKVQTFVAERVTESGDKLARLFFGPDAHWKQLQGPIAGPNPALNWTSRKRAAG